jgi:hypothetical protein
MTVTEMVDLLAGSTGLEPATSGLTVQCANQAAPRARIGTCRGYTTVHYCATILRRWASPRLRRALAMGDIAYACVRIVEAPGPCPVIAWVAVAGRAGARHASPGSRPRYARANRESARRRRRSPIRPRGRCRVRRRSLPATRLPPSTPQCASRGPRWTPQCRMAPARCVRSLWSIVPLHQAAGPLLLGDRSTEHAHRSNGGAGSVGLPIGGPRRTSTSI